MDIPARTNVHIILGLIIFEFLVCDPLLLVVVALLLLVLLVLLVVVVVELICLHI